MDIKTNDLVVFKKGLYADEEGAVYRIQEYNTIRPHESLQGLTPHHYAIQHA